MTKRIVIGSDHAGFDAKEIIKEILECMNYNVIDIGCESSKKKVDYPVIAEKLCSYVLKEKVLGILICGSGTGMEIAANKIKGIRAAFSYDDYSAKMARKDNDANVLTLRGREFDSSLYNSIVSSFLDTNFSGKDRHKKRIKMISKIRKSE